MSAHLFRFIWYGGIGLINTAVDFSIYSVSVLLFDLHVAPANVLAFLVAVSMSYLLNARFTFRDVSAGGSAGFRFPRFLAVNLAGLVISTVMLVTLAEPLGPLAAKLLAVAVVALWGYAACHIFVFRPTASPRKAPLPTLDRKEGC